MERDKLKDENVDGKVCNSSCDTDDVLVSWDDGWKTNGAVDMPTLMRISQPRPKRIGVRVYDSALDAELRHSIYACAASAGVPLGHDNAASFACC